ncbi:hypothetical protein FSP39_007405 [Pinctada imbricata]|uniref:Orn/DAP/Arg decarboxylase 2 C-terminal domain-containing protein n=1 Tax=Pinctada imbricata TaxID=66713 RepID=A0AA88Y3I1_PINIB|nr:hypothetical protein FSP39_007405 [Pinctada imbricata]
MVIDGSMTEVIRPCLYDAYHHIDLACPSQHEDTQKFVFDVVGPVCESADFLGKNRLMSTPHPGCGVAIFDVGAYCGSMASNYNLRIRPAEILISGSSSRLIRKPDTYEDLMRPYDPI